MIELENLILFISLSIAICAAPGPTVLFTISNGISGNHRRALFGLLGTASANIVWISCCAIGVATFIQKSQSLFMCLKYVGAVYLFYLGVLSLKSKSPTGSKKITRNNLKVNSPFYQGFLTTITNPKALIYYIAFFPQFVSGRGSYSLEILCLGICYIIILFLVLSIYLIVSNKITKFFERRSSTLLFNKIIGIGFIGASVSVVISK